MSLIESKDGGSVPGESLQDGVCYMCDLYCPTKIRVINGKAVEIDMLDKRAHDLCPRWKAQLDFVYHKDRILHPLRRVGERGEGKFERISWDEALDIVSSKFLEIKKSDGAKAVAFYIAYTKEPRPYFRRLVHGFGSPNYCTETSSCFSAGWLAASLNFGKDYGYLLGNSREIDPASKCMIIWSSSVRQSSPKGWKDYLDAKRNGLKFIVVDPRRTPIASMADIHLQLRPGTDGALALGLMNVIIKEDLYDKEFVENWTVGFSSLRELVDDYTPEKVQDITWVPAEKIREAAIMFAENKPGKIRTSPGATIHHQNGVQNTRAILLVSAIMGNIEVPGGNRMSSVAPELDSITLQETVPTLAPGIGSQKFPLFTDMFEEMQSNAIVEQILTGKPYPLRALFAAGLNLQFFPNSRHLEETLKKLELVVDIDFFHTPATRISDIVLPISTWLERHILIVRTGGEIKLVEPAIEPVGETWPEFKIYAELAERLGLKDLFWGGDIIKCFNYMLEPTGITVEDLRKAPNGTIECPVPVREAKHYLINGFQTPSGKVEIWSSTLEKYGYDPLPVYNEPVESPLSRPDLAKSYPLVLTTGARTISYTHSQHRNLKKLRKLVPEPLLEIHPSDAEIRGIQSGDMVAVSSPRGIVKVKANVTDNILSGVVHLPHHWPDEANANILCDDIHLDPISGFPAFKSQLCQVAKLKI
jgi:anaerobic selenocysteine-containing dehydrogenase